MRGIRIASTAIFMLRYQIGCGGLTYACVDLERVRYLAFVIDATESPDRGLGRGRSTSMTTALVPRRSRACLLHPRPSVF